MLASQAGRRGFESRLPLFGGSDVVSHGTRAPFLFLGVVQLLGAVQDPRAACEGPTRRRRQTADRQTSYQDAHQDRRGRVVAGRPMVQGLPGHDRRALCAQPPPCRLRQGISCCRHDACPGRPDHVRPTDGAGQRVPGAGEVGFVGRRTRARDPSWPAVRTVFGNDPTMIQSNFNIHHRGVSTAPLGEYSRGHRGHLSQDHVQDRRCPDIVDNGTWQSRPGG